MHAYARSVLKQSFDETKKISKRLKSAQLRPPSHKSSSHEAKDWLTAGLHEPWGMRSLAHWCGTQTRGHTTSSEA